MKNIDLALFLLCHIMLILLDQGELNLLSFMGEDYSLVFTFTHNFEILEAPLSCLESNLPQIIL